jgi:tetratricopeptide (TPR) repeat protein
VTPWVKRGRIFAGGARFAPSNGNSTRVYRGGTRRGAPTLLHFDQNPGRRGASVESLGARIAADPSLMQLLPLAALKPEAGASGLAAQKAVRREAQVAALLAHSRILAEIARRTGEVETLGRAASVIRRAYGLADADHRLASAAGMAHASVLILSATLFGDGESVEVAKHKLDEAAAGLSGDVDRAHFAALRGRLLAQEALIARSMDIGRAAAEVLARAADRLVVLGETAAAVDARCDRADLLIGAGVQRKSRRLLDLALSELSAVSQALNAAYHPLSSARAETLRGQALAALGDLSGDAGTLAQSVAVLLAVAEDVSFDHSPLDAARASHALGLSLQALGEASEEAALFDRAVAVFAPALQALDAQPLLPFRSVVAYDAAACLARRAERRGDLPALERAEAAFRDALKTRSAAKDPVSWAVTQVALARIYEAEAELRGDTGERADAAFALTAALDVFSEHGLRSLSTSALAALERVRPAAT